MTVYIMRKAQLGSEIFVYILAILVIGLIVVFGYKKVVELREKGSDIEVLHFKKQLESLVKISMSSGNIFVEEMLLPKGFSKICFIDLTKSADGKLNAPTNKDYSPIIYDSWNAKNQKNVFLVQGPKIESFYIDEKKLLIGIARTTAPIKCSGNADSYICCDVNELGKIKLRFTGNGKSISISEP